VENEEKLTQLRKMLRKEKMYVEQSFTFDNTLEARLVQLNMELAKALAEYGEEHRRVKFLKENIRQLTDLAKKHQEGKVKISSIKSLNENRLKLLQEYNDTEIERYALKSKRAAYEKVLTEINASIVEIPEKYLRFRRLLRDKENIEKIFELLQTKYQEQRIRYEMQTADVVQWEKAYPPRRPIPQGSRFGLLVMMLLGLVVGIGIAYLVEYADQSVKSPQEIEEELNLPLLGIIPLTEEENKVLTMGSRSRILEPYRSLRTNIRYTNLGSDKRVILVTSAIQGDGKTTKVCNLAISFAIDGKRVMVIDADLRRSAVHKLFNVERDTGLSEYLTGQAGYNEIKKSVFNDMITVVSAGKRPPNPAEILGSARFKDLIKNGLQDHDIVLIDSPAVVPVSDALLIAPYVDSTIIIGRSFKTPLKAIDFTKNSLLRIEANIIGVIFNGVEQKKRYYPYYYSYYSYYKSRYYHYYDEDEETEKLPKNLREFLVIAAKEMWNETKKNLRFIKQKFFKWDSSLKGRGRRFLLLVCLGLFLIVLAAVLRLFIFTGHKEREKMPEDFRYSPSVELPDREAQEAIKELESGPDAEPAPPQDLTEKIKPPAGISVIEKKEPLPVKDTAGVTDGKNK
jgi:capsular exopolysaccharide synthesis family protein